MGKEVKNMNYEAKNRLTAQLSQLDNGQNAKRELVESARIKLTEAALLKSEAYSAYVREIVPLADAALNQIIYPWWQEFKHSTLSKQIVSVLSDQSFSFHLNLSEQIAYYWPDKIIDELASAQPFKSEAIDAANHRSQGQSLELLFEEFKKPKPADAWTGYFHFSGFKNDYQQLSFKPWNKAQQCWAFAIGAQRLKVSLDPLENPQAIFTNFNPMVYVEFGKQIEEGKVWEVLEQSFTKALET